MRVRIAILGGGPAGYEAALVAVELGAEVTLVERDGIGGACVLTDCVPSKALDRRPRRCAARSTAPTRSAVVLAGRRVDAAAAQRADARPRRRPVRRHPHAAGPRGCRGHRRHAARLLGRTRSRSSVRRSGEDAEERLEADAILLAVGRDPAGDPRQRAGRRAHPRLAPALRPAGAARAPDRRRFRCHRRRVRLRLPRARLAR